MLQVYSAVLVLACMCLQASNRVVIMSTLSPGRQTSVSVLCEKLFGLDTPSSVVLLLDLEVSFFCFFSSIDMAFLSARVRNQWPG